VRLERETGVKTLDVAKRLLDYGFHAPTVYFPLVVPGALMIEPTETETKETLDELVGAMLAILAEAREAPEKVKEAPHHTVVGRMDEAAPRASRACAGRVDDGGSRAVAGSRQRARPRAPPPNPRMPKAARETWQANLVRERSTLKFGDPDLAGLEWLKGGRPSQGRAAVARTIESVGDIETICKTEPAKAGERSGSSSAPRTTPIRPSTSR